jgi:hypothetical protein
MTHCAVRSFCLDFRVHSTGEMTTGNSDNPGNLLGPRRRKSWGLLTGDQSFPTQYFPTR